MDPYADLLIFRAPGETDVPHVTSIIGLDPADPARGWSISTKGLVRGGDVRAHVEALLAAVSGRHAAIARLRAQGYWVSVIFHDTRRPDPAALAAADAALEALDITFDFELERP